MVEWSDKGVVIATEKSREKGFIATIFTEKNGIHKGWVRITKTPQRGGHGQAIYQPGNFVRVTWKARLTDHLGQWKGELLSNLSLPYFHHSRKLLAMSAACWLLTHALAERQVETEIYEEFHKLFESLNTEDWQYGYLMWEIKLLEFLGYGLDFSHCAVHGPTCKNLTHLSPNTGRAVCREAAKPYLSKLIALPRCLKGRESDSLKDEDYSDALQITDYFLHKALPHLQQRYPLNLRQRLLDQWCQEPAA